MEDEVLARTKASYNIALKNVEEINGRLDPHIAEINRKMNALLRSPLPLHEKIYRYWKTIDHINSFNGENVACKRGCSHCCHVAVAMMPAEAEALGRKIKVKPVKVKHLVSNFEGFDFGYHRPCTFLVDNQCSIYEYRPTACRLYYSLDKDDFLCSFGESGREIRDVPAFDRAQLHFFMFQLLQPAQKECLADIRSFFPKGVK